MGLFSSISKIAGKVLGGIGEVVSPFIGDIIGVGGSYLASREAAGASGEALAAQNQATQMQLAFLRETRADIADAVEKGLIDLDEGFNAAIQQLMPMASLQELNMARELIMNPQAIMDRPSTRFQFGQGLEALQAGFSRTGGGGLSGPSLKAATEYGQNFASLALDQELSRLQPLIDVGLQARTNIANLKQNWGTSMANLRVGGAGQVGNVTGQMIPVVAQQGQNVASDIINRANLRTNLYGGMTDLASNIGEKYLPKLFSGGR